MKIIKLILGGIVAVLSAFGVTLTVLVVTLSLEMRNQTATGIGHVAYRLAPVLHSGWSWVVVFVIFSIGFFIS
jgi:hypothetical protein